MLSPIEIRLGEALRLHPAKFDFRWSDAAKQDLLELLFRSLAGWDDDHFRLLFPLGRPTDGWNLSREQGTQEGSEYTEAARGKRCGHIFSSGETTYHCATCTIDENCVLCSRCFEASEHTGHRYSIVISQGSNGCCDCGDPEAFKIPFACGIHTALNKPEEEPKRSDVPITFQNSIRGTVGKVLDYFCDVTSCAPEQLRLPKSVESIQKDEELSRLSPQVYGGEDVREKEATEYAVCLWNDEKHTIDQVKNQVARACRERSSYGLRKAHETDEVGRAVVKYGRDLNTLLKITRVIEQIKLPVTVRSSRDTYREMMCGAIMDWLLDIANCSVGNDGNILQVCICEQILQPWRLGSLATNAGVGAQGIHDYDMEERRSTFAISNGLEAHPFLLNLLARRPMFGAEDDEDDEDDDGDGDGEEGGEDGEQQGVVEEVEVDEDEEVEDNMMNRTVVNLEDILAVIGQGMQPRPPGDNEGGDGDEQDRTGEDEQHHDQHREEGDEDEQMEDQEENVPQHTTQPEEPQQAALPQHAVEAPDPETLNTKEIGIPRTPGVSRPSAKAPDYWKVNLSHRSDYRNLPIHEDFRRRTRLDWIILFDVRLWKSLRHSIRDLCLATVINVPQFKRILGIRFAALYTTLAQVFLIADREPECSVVNLSVQLLSTPSIVEEVVERGNFLTKLLAVFYTYLTTRQVGEPNDVDTSLTLNTTSGSMTPRRLTHYFSDFKFVITSSGRVKSHVRLNTHYLSQFLDIAKLTQGITPSERKLGTHVEYETDHWVSSSLLLREIHRLCRMFGECYRQPILANPTILPAITTCAAAAMSYCLGLEKDRFENTDAQDIVKFKHIPFGEFELDDQERVGRHRVVDFTVEKGKLSFYHPIHYLLSYLFEYARPLSQCTLRGALAAAAQEVKANAGSYKSRIEDLSDDDIILALFDYPLRMPVWCAQIKANLWVRNGISLRHQLAHYKATVSRDLTYSKDIFLLQTGFVINDPSRFLASAADRYGLVEWMRNNFAATEDFDQLQRVEIAEDFLHTLIVMLTDRNSLTYGDNEVEVDKALIRKEIAHFLCFKPLSFNELTSRMHDKFVDSPLFDEVLDEAAHFRPPKGMNDTGMYELKEDCLALVNPYNPHYNKNQRDDAEALQKEWLAKKTGKKPSDVVLEPTFPPIPEGAYTQISAFTKTPLFAQLMHRLLVYCLIFCDVTPDVPIVRIETMLQVLLHLLIVAAMDDPKAGESTNSFTYHALTRSKETTFGNITIVGLLHRILGVPEYQSCVPKIRHLATKFRDKYPREYAEATKELEFSLEEVKDESSDAVSSEKESKKKQALARQAKVMAQFQEQQKNFISAQTDIDWGMEDLSEEEEAAESKAWKYPTGNCMLCQEETDDGRLYGTFAMMANSRNLRKTVQHDPDYFREVLETPDSLDRSSDSIRPFGVAGQNVEKTRKLDATGGEIIAERRGIGKGFPPQYADEGPVVTGCCHIMHHSCFKEYIHTAERRHTAQIARAHPDRLDLKEFICPLCKALGNAFIPIIWKPKEQASPSVLEPGESFEDFMRSSLPWSISRFNGHNMITASDRFSSSGYGTTFSEYINERFTPEMASRVEDWLKQPANFFPPYGSFRDVDPMGSTSSDEIIQELASVYQRLRDTMRVNKIQTQFEQGLNRMNSDLTRVDGLIKSLGYTISAHEIAQRGVGAPSERTLLDNLPHQATTVLRILAETIFSYASFGSLQKDGFSSTMDEVRELQDQKLRQLFFGHPGISGMGSHADSVQPLLLQDSFIFLAECACSVIPQLKFDALHITRLCYMAEIVKCVLSVVVQPDTFLHQLAMEDVFEEEDPQIPEWIVYKRPHPYLDPDESGYDDMSRVLNLLIFVNGHYNRCLSDSHLMSKHLLVAVSKSPKTVLRMLRTLIEKYALTFLRKTTILFHTSYSVDFPDVPEAYSDLPELSRLTTLLRLPNMNDLIDQITINNGANFTPQVVMGWLECYSVRQEQDYRDHVWLPHTGIPELIGLPEHYDVLLDECSKRRCPTTGKAINDPAICLFCGEIFCSQAFCCQRGELGGCSQHMPKCGGEIGLFIIIRKCIILFRHNRNGSFVTAPYLDEHGEPDRGLRHGRRLMLNQQRYDRLVRDAWLSHGVPSVISRRLDGDMNPGGWESL